MREFKFNLGDMVVTKATLEEQRYRFKIVDGDMREVQLARLGVVKIRGWHESELGVEIIYHVSYGGHVERLWEEDLVTAITLFEVWDECRKK